MEQARAEGSVRRRGEGFTQGERAARETGMGARVGSPTAGVCRSTTEVAGEIGRERHLPFPLAPFRRRCSAHLPDERGERTPQRRERERFRGRESVKKREKRRELEGANVKKKSDEPEENPLIFLLSRTAHNSKLFAQSRRRRRRRRRERRRDFPGPLSFLAVPPFSPLSGAPGERTTKPNRQWRPKGCSRC